MCLDPGDENNNADKEKAASSSGNVFPVWLPNRLTSAGLEPDLSNTEKSCFVSYYIQFLFYKMYNHNIQTSIVSQCLRHLF